MNPILPANVDAERSILALIVINPGAYDEASALGLTVPAFSVDANRRIYQACTVLADSARPIDSVTLPEELDRHGELEAVGGRAYVSELLTVLPDRPSLKSYVRIVLDKYAGRKLVHVCAATIDSLGTGSTSGEAIGMLSESLLQIQTGSDDAPAQRVGCFTNAALRDWNASADGDGDLIGLTTGVDALDAATTGIRQGELWTYGGYTSGGKTAAALQAAAANCRKDVPVAFFSLEMGKNDLLQRLWANEGDIDYTHIRYPRRLDPLTRDLINRTALAVAEWPLFVVEDSSLSIQKLVPKARLLIRQEGIKLVVVDYAQLVSAPAKDERDRVTKTSNALRSLAKDTGVPVVLLSQLSRPKDGNLNARPNKFHLKESGSLENDAHVIVLTYRPVDSLGTPTGEDELIIAKQRAGAVGSERVPFDSRTLMFRKANVIRERRALTTPSLGAR